MKTAKLFAVLTLGLALAGCLPEQKIVWSPDGASALVLGKDALYTMSPEGKLSPAAQGAFGKVAWLPDSKSFVAQRSQKVESWKEMSQMLPPTLAQQIPVQAESFLAQLLQYKGDMKSFRPQNISPELMTAGALYLRDTHDQELTASRPKEWEEIKKDEFAVYVTQLYRLEGDKVVADKVLGCGVSAVASLKVSPTGKAYAFAAGDLSVDNLTVLYVGSIEGGAAVQVESRPVAPSFDWSADGRFLAFVMGNASKPSSEVTLGSLAVAEVCDAQGAVLLPKTSTQPDQPVAPFALQELAGLMFSGDTMVTALRDGRILFNAAQVQLPATPNDLAQKLTLFAVAPGKQATVSRLIAQADEARLPDGVGIFVVSPDQTRAIVAGPGGAKGAIAVVDLASSNVTTLFANNEKGELKVMPAWQSDSAFTAVVPAGAPEGSAKRAEVVLWTSEKGTWITRCLSRDWSDAVTAAATGEKAPEAASQPAAEQK